MFSSFTTHVFLLRTTLRLGVNTFFAALTPALPPRPPSVKSRAGFKDVNLWSAGVVAAELPFIIFASVVIFSERTTFSNNHFVMPSTNIYNVRYVTFRYCLNWALSFVVVCFLNICFGSNLMHIITFDGHVANK